MTESDLKTLKNKIRDLSNEKATNVKPEDLGLTTNEELDKLIETSKGQLIDKDPVSGNYFKKFQLITKGYQGSTYIIDPQSSAYIEQADSTIIPNSPMVFAVRSKGNYSEYSEGGYNIRDSEWKPTTENVQKIIDLNS